MNNVYFITGFPGFLATKLLDELLLTRPEASYRLLVLSQERLKASKLLEARTSGSYAIELIDGDITRPDLGITPEKAIQLKDEITHCFHLAALYDLTAGWKLCEKINVIGTENVTRWLSFCKNLQRYSYFSTAYVSGTREGLIKENELIMPARFRNHYEETKFLAEKIVEEAKKSLPVTIFRPGIVTGDSVSGETLKFDGPYYLLTFLRKLKYIPVPMIGEGSARIHLVPYDFVIRSAVYLTNLKQAEGKTYHLINPASPTIKDAFTTMLQEMHNKKTRYSIPVSVASLALSLKSLQRLLGVPKETLDYFSGTHHYDCSVLTEDLKDSGITCPSFSELAKPMVLFYKENAHNKNLAKTF
ncbi:SDR family oxidoreductase [Fictibacillus aquaticus]|uniref:Thioester reductase (TE) domain-containing protein n=1 Tax=Fictibacillus aquaticus TaxID=2021314 RepID=A0A235FCK6_9BACL|nr:SDR family oxidoreductase [Fictibacillus aquaticus]OYD58687.1 hypothetical protein CGZ90_01950 [Fictibacillus aquaticus]